MGDVDRAAGEATRAHVVGKEEDVVLAVAAASADEITELVALPPADGASSTSQVLKWVKVTYPSAVTTCSDVTMEDATGSPELGAWDTL